MFMEVYSARNLESHPFLMSRSFERRVANEATESNGLNLFLQVKGVVE